jgi:hypothetical protein
MLPALWIAAGAAAMYFFDPERGSNRRNRMLGRVDQFKADHPELVQTAEEKSVVLRERAQGFIEPIKTKIQEKIDPPPADLDPIDKAAGKHDDKVTELNSKKAA